AGNPLSQVELDGHGWFDDAVDWVKDNGKDLGHAALDVAGLVPVVGEAADLANSAWYAKEGDYANAALSAASAIPFAGWGASAVKAGKYAVKGADAVQSGVKAADAGQSAAKTASKAADAGANGAKTAPAPKPAPKPGGSSAGKPAGAGGGKAGGTASTGKKASGSGSGGGQATNAGGTSATGGGGRSVMFGQARVSPNFSAKSNAPDYIKGRSINDVAADLRGGRLSADQMHITAFPHQGKLVTENNRGLTALSKAGMRPTNVTVKPKSQMPKEVLDRLKERTPLGDTLPSNRIAITPSQRDWTILDVVSTP
ncbi:MAG TPA: hypothetical protein VFT95_12670, partial [Micromonosporaceae bacterium]|nr:hypothetical protein [Micromonosporaceae bacterium]